MKVKITSAIVILSIGFLFSIVFKGKFVRLQERKQIEIDKMEEGEKPRDSKVPATVHPVTKEPKSETSVLVTGILYSETKPSIIIGDKRKIWREEDTINGITIVKIHKDKVEFEKNGQRWTQKVGEIPNLE